MPGWRSLSYVVFFVAAVVLCGFSPNRGAAQALYYRSIPIGERAIGLGGAFTGVASDPSATYYNPAGIMQGGRFELLGSLSSIVFTRLKIENAFDSPNADATFESTNTTTLPRFIGTVVKLGRRRFGDHQFALGYSTLEVDRNGFGVGHVQNEPEASLDLRLSDNYVSRWYGVSFAAQVSRKVALGLTAYATVQRTNYREDIGLATGGTFNENGLRVGGDFVTTSTEIAIRAYHIVLRLGALHVINPRWKVGYMFQAPGIPVSQKGNVLQRTTIDISPNEPLFFLFDSDDTSTSAPIPFEIRAGFGFLANPETLLSVDVSVSGPVRARNVFTRPEDLAEIDGQLGTYFANSTERRWTPNVAVGAEHRFGKAVVAGGLFTNISAAPDVPQTTVTYAPAQVNVFGASVSVGVDTGGFRLTVGTTGLFGRGDALTAMPDLAAQQVSYERTKANRGALILYIAGAVSVASETTDRVQEKRRKKKKKGEEDDAAEDEGEQEAEPDSESQSDEETEAVADEEEKANQEPTGEQEPSPSPNP